MQPMIADCAAPAGSAWLSGTELPVQRARYPDWADRDRRPERRISRLGHGPGQSPSVVPVLGRPCRRIDYERLAACRRREVIPPEMITSLARSFDLQVAAGLEYSQVSGVEPAAEEGPLGGVRIFQVPLHGDVSPNNDLAESLAVGGHAGTVLLVDDRHRVRPAHPPVGNVGRQATAGPPGRRSRAPGHWSMAHAPTARWTDHDERAQGRRGATGPDPRTAQSRSARSGGGSSRRILPGIDSRPSRRRE
jgi:hypothetical protein